MKKLWKAICVAEEWLELLIFTAISIYGIYMFIVDVIL